MPLDFLLPTSLSADLPSSAVEAGLQLPTTQSERPFVPSMPVTSAPRPPAESLAAQLASALEAHLQREQQESETFPPRTLSMPLAKVAVESEWRGALQEVRHANTAELSRTRHLVEGRMEDMAQALHSDMRRLREECRAEWETQSRDVFRAATALSQAQDRLQRLEATVAVLQNQIARFGTLPVEKAPDTNRLDELLTVAASVPV